MDKKTTTAKYKVSLKILGKTYTASGKSAREAMGKLEPQTTRSFGVLTLQKGKIVKEKVVMASILFRAFNGSPTSRDIGIKNLSLLFENI